MSMAIPDKNLKWYLCGQMSNIPQFNIPLFDRVAGSLREQGYDVVSPAELDDPVVRAECLASPDGAPSVQHGTWGDFLARDVKLVADEIGGIVTLPDWQKSRGARLEVFVGLLTGKQFAQWDDLTEFAYALHRDFYRLDLRENMP